MSMLTGQVEHVIGVDTHRDTNTAASWRSLTNTQPGDGSGRSKAAAASAPDSPPTYSSEANGWSRLTGRPGQRGATRRSQDR